MQRQILEGIQREREEAARRKRLPVAVRIGDEYEEMKALYPGQPVYAAVGLMRCPWYKCSAEFALARFLTKRGGEQFFFYCPKCGETAITFRDIVEVWGQNTYPIRELQAGHAKHPGRYLRWMNMLRLMKEAMIKFQSVQPDYRETVLMPETRNERAMTLRTSVINEEDDPDIKSWGG